MVPGVRLRLLVTASRAGEFPGLCTSRWITDPAAASADLSLPAISQRLFGCAPSHRWGFELDGTTPPHTDTSGLPTELDLLLHA
ncbi:hypothetical protein [Streptomyces acidiscabies]|uniref:hypothetical protein n=1 Tax=Streptomyces acidiscabies TaxID=42234 RepID=UPI0009520C16|nr:hypothetical protein [Streptomyces acidiscabies]